MASAEEDCIIQFIGMNAADQNPELQLEVATGAVSQGTLAPTGDTFAALPLIRSVKGKPSKKIKAFVKAVVSGDIIESEESDMLIPLEFWNISTGKLDYVRPTKLEEWTGFTPSGTVDSAALSATEYAFLCSYSAPDGYAIRLAAGNKHHVYIGDDTA